jgi:hypothetical protein
MTYCIADAQLGTLHSAEYKGFGYEIHSMSSREVRLYCHQFFFLAIIERELTKLTAIFIGRHMALLSDLVNIFFRSQLLHLVVLDGKSNDIVFEIFRVIGVATNKRLRRYHSVENLSALEE